ncbi:MAG: hypothetical protein IPK01_09640 [Acidobacteria bacterium]|nr:hypothetical protein [Acidobacteriota bacterium]
MNEYPTVEPPDPIYTSIMLEFGSRVPNVSLHVPGSEVLYLKYPKAASRFGLAARSSQPSWM